MIANKNNCVLMRGMIAMCVLLGTLVVIYYGRGPCSNPNRMDGILAALLLGHNQAPPPLYDPSQDYCFGDKTNTEKYGEKCWFFADTVPFGNWELINPCGELC